jgi:hypothetical protein
MHTSRQIRAFRPRVLASPKLSRAPPFAGCCACERAGHSARAGSQLLPLEPVQARPERLDGFVLPVVHNPSQDDARGRVRARRLERERPGFLIWPALPAEPSLSLLHHEPAREHDVNIVRQALTGVSLVGEPHHVIDRDGRDLVLGHVVSIAPVR